MKRQINVMTFFLALAAIDRNEISRQPKSVVTAREYLCIAFGGLMMNFS